MSVLYIYDDHNEKSREAGGRGFFGVYINIYMDGTGTRENGGAVFCLVLFDIV